MPRFVTATLFITLVVLAPGKSFGGLVVYQVIDNTPGQRFGLNVPDPNNPPTGFAFDISKILAHEVQTSNFSISLLSNGTEITRTLDVSNLTLRGFVLDTGKQVYSAPLTMTQLANIGGFDHFNFLQTISYLPTDEQVGLINLNTGQLTSVNLPILDPILDSKNNLFYIHSARANASSYIAYDGPSDSNPAVWNDTFGTANPLELGNYLTTTRLSFIDNPRLPSSFISLTNNRDYMGFNNSLVGINTNGTINTEWAGIGTRMSWSSNVIYDVNGYVGGQVYPPIYSANPFSGDVPLSSGGTIFDVQVDATSVPEPSSIILLGIALTGILSAQFLKQHSNIFQMS